MARPARSQQRPADPTTGSVEDSWNIQATSVSKTGQEPSRTDSAIFVIAGEDIRRSGVTSIPDLLRMVPGLNVAQIDANTWAISARGFNGRFSNELLVLVDGRSVNTPTFGGVFWDVLDIPLEDVQRVEVIRGPGGSIWGANAVNGVINIVTKKASDTHGGLVVAGSGNIDQGFGTLQYGGTAGNRTDYRVYTKFLNEDHLPDPSGQNGGDGWHMLQGGFRSDSTLSPKDTLMLQGNLYSAREGTPTSVLPSVASPGLQGTDLLVNLSGGFLQGVWDHVSSSRSDTSLQISYDRYQRNDLLHEGRDTLDLGFQHHVALGERQNLAWGLAYRYSKSEASGSLTVSLVPAELGTQVFGSFIQDEIAVVPARLYLTVGTRLDRDYYTGFNVTPSARVAWTPSEHQMIWAAVSDAVRTPSALDAGSRVNLGRTSIPTGASVKGFPEAIGPVVLLSIIGNPNVKNEGLIGYEMGYRTTVLKQLSIDFAAYFNDYSNLETTEPSTPFSETTPSPPHLVMPFIVENLMHGETHGLEIAANWKVTNRWTLNPGYAFEQIHMHLDPTSQDTTSVSAAEGSSPVHSAQLRSRLSLSHGLIWDTSAYFVDRLTDPNVPSYTRLDTGLSWQLGETIYLTLAGQNLLRDHHEEFADSTGSARTTLIKRSAYSKFVWRF